MKTRLPAVVAGMAIILFAALNSIGPTDRHATGLGSAVPPLDEARRVLAAADIRIDPGGVARPEEGSGSSGSPSTCARAIVDYVAGSGVDSAEAAVVRHVALSVEREGDRGQVPAGILGPVDDDTWMLVGDDGTVIRYGISVSDERCRVGSVERCMS